jgi:hypothetical protein
VGWESGGVVWCGVVWIDHSQAFAMILSEVATASGWDGRVVK